TIADMNIPANDAPAEQALAIAPPTRTDDQNFPLSKWVPIGKSNCILDVQKSQRNPIFPIAVALLKNTNFFRAFTASSTILAIYIQQFWDNMCFNASTGLYSCQLDEQWFNLHKDILRDALGITPTNDNNLFLAPPSSDTVIEYVITMGYRSTLRNVSAMSVNALYQPWRTILSMINMCLTEFVQSIQTFLTDRKNLATASRGKKKTALLFSPNVRFTKLIIHHLRTKHNIHPRSSSPLYYSHDENVMNTLRFIGKDSREIFGMSISDALLTDEIKGAPYYIDYQEHVAKYQQIMDAERGKAEEGGATDSSKATKVTKPKAAKVTKPAGDPALKKIKLVKETPDDPLPAKRSKAGLVGKRRTAKSLLRLIDEPSDEGVLVEEPAHDDEEADIHRALELSLKDQGERTQGPAHPVVLREPDSEKFQPLPETPKKKSPTEKFIFQRSPPMPTESSAYAESPSMDAELNLTDSETESDEEASKINARNQEEGQAGPNPGVQDEGQAGPNPGIAVESQLQSSHVVHAGPNLEHMDVGTFDASTQQKPEQMDEEFTITAYPNVQENLKLPTEDQVILEEPASSTGTLSSLQNLEKDLSFTDQFFVEKPQEEEPWKTNAEAEVQSMVSVPIHQDTSSVPPMTTPVIDLTTMQSDSPLPPSTATTSIITTITSLPPPPQPQQSTIDPILVSHIGELEQHMVDLIQNNLTLEERLDKQRTRLYNLENLNIPHKVSQAIDEIVIDAVDWAMQAPLRVRFRDLLTVDMKEILQQRMFEDDSYKAHTVHNDLYEALQKSLETPPGSPPSQPPPPPHLAGASGALGTSRALGSSQLPPPLPPLSIGTSGSAQQQGNKAPSSSKTTASASQSMAWTTSDTRYESAGVFGTHELSPNDSLMQDNSIPEEQVHLSDDEDSETDHQSKANSRKDWWKPLPEEEIPVTPEPTWTIPSFNKRDDFPEMFQMEKCHKMLTDQVNWANPEGDQVRINVNRPLPFDGPPGHVTIPTNFFFNKDLEYLRYDSNGSCPTLLISKMKAANYLDFGLELLLSEQMWIDDVCTYDISAKYGISHWWFTRQKFYIDRHDSPSRRKDVRTYMRILSVVIIKAYSRYGSSRSSFWFRQTDAIYCCQTMDPKLSDSTAVILIALASDVKDSDQATQLTGYEIPTFWTKKDMTRINEFIAAIERRLKMRRIYRNLECFIGGRVRDIDYRLL
ncbi:retrovirus-related pol polyprotein from transposon TNT 1-94, partial [Tanacetum coccineum]